MKDMDAGEVRSVFTIILQAELVPANINDYREKLLHLRKLRHDLVQPLIPEGPLQEVKTCHSLLPFPEEGHREVTFPGFIFS